MALTVKVNHPHFPEGTVFNVGGLDRVPNGGSLEIDDEMERLFIMNQGQTVEDAFANDAVMEVSGSSALDQDEANALVEAYGPQPEEEVAALANEGEPLVAAEQAENEDKTTPAWMTSGEGDSNA